MLLCPAVHSGDFLMLHDYYTLSFWWSDIFVLFSARHCSRCRCYYHYYYKNKTTILLFQAIWPTLVCLTLMVVGCSSATICAFMWQINKMMESRGSRRGCVLMIRAAVQHIYAQTNVTTLIISVCLIIYETERFIITCWMWEQGNDKKKKEKSAIKGRFTAEVGQ